MIALAIRAAFHFAYLIFCCVSSSGAPQMLTRWKNVAAASNVVAVCLEVCLLVRPGLTRRRGRAWSLLGDFICLHYSLCSVKCLLRKLLNVCLTGYIIDDRILVRIFGFSLWSTSSALWICRTPYTRGGRACSSLSIKFIVYVSTSSLVECSCFARTWLTTQYSPRPLRN